MHFSTAAKKAARGGLGTRLIPPPPPPQKNQRISSLNCSSVFPADLLTVEHELSSQELPDTLVLRAVIGKVTVHIQEGTVGTVLWVEGGKGRVGEGGGGRGGRGREGRRKERMVARCKCNRIG